MILVSFALLTNLVLSVLHLTGVRVPFYANSRAPTNAKCASMTLVRDLLVLLTVLVTLSVLAHRRRRHAPSRLESAFHTCVVLLASVGAAWHVSDASRCDVVLLDLAASDVLTFVAGMLYMTAAAAAIVQYTWLNQSVVSPVIAPVVVLLVASPVVTVAQVLLAISGLVVLLFGSIGGGVTKEDQLQFELAVSLFKRGVEKEPQHQQQR
jgi:hypothetical protein